jgi:DNA-binding NarL/FixJ family response regulator
VGLHHSANVIWATKMGPMSSELINVVVADDHPAFRAAAAEVVSAAEGFVLASAVESGPEAIAEITRLVGPVLVVMDVQMPGMTGVAATREIHDRHLNATVVLVSGYDRRDLADINECGAAAFVPKEDLTPALLTAIWREHAAS